MEKIYNLKLHEIMEIPTKGAGKIEVMRVPGGWIYALDFPGYRQAPSIFVPLNDEFDLHLIPEQDLPKKVKKMDKKIK